jgi:hypothetical protein
MGTNDEIDPYEAIIKTKWTPESGELKMELIPAGTEVSVVKRGVLVTDNKGMLLIRKPEDAQIFSNLLNHVWEIWVIPELKRREEAKIPAPYPLKKFIVLFDTEKGKVPTIKFNDEYEFKVHIRIKRGLKINKGDPITFDQIVDFEPIEPPSRNSKPIAFFIFHIDGRQISVYFDFRPNNQKFNVDEWKDEGKWLSEAYLETILARQFGHLSLIIPRLSKYDIPFTIGIKSKKMEGFCNIVEKSFKKEEVDEKISHSITRTEVEYLVNSWMTLDLFATRAGILKEVSKSFKNGIYGGVILLLMSQVEVSRGKGLRENGEAKRWTTRIKEFDEIVKKEEIGPLTSRILDGTLHFLDHSNLYKRFTWNSTNINRVNRHASMHGKDVSFNTRANAIRMILLFDALYWIFLAISCKEENNKSYSD